MNLICFGFQGPTPWPDTEPTNTTIPTKSFDPIFFIPIIGVALILLSVNTLLLCRLKRTNRATNEIQEPAKECDELIRTTSGQQELAGHRCPQHAVYQSLRQNRSITTNASLSNASQIYAEPIPHVHARPTLAHRLSAQKIPFTSPEPVASCDWRETAAVSGSSTGHYYEIMPAALTS